VVDLLERYALIVLPGLVVAEQLGVPLPAVPMLLGFAYMSLHFGATAAALIWVHRSHRSHFALVRTTLVAATGLALAITVPPLFGWHSLIVLSGSMEPTLMTGGMVVDEVITPLDARPGDIVTFKDPLRPRQLTHRLQKVTVEGDTFKMVTLGDANDVPERWSVPRDGHIGRVVAHLPKLGYVRQALSGRYARLGALGMVLLLGATMLVDVWRPRRPEA
jgi:signal peptidase